MNRQLVIAITLLTILTALIGYCADPLTIWNRNDLFQPPQTYQTPPEYKAIGVKLLFYDGVPYQGKPTRVFACYNLPESKDGAKVPGIVLVHGGGGSAFPYWVRLWNSRGYAAIAMDTCGSVERHIAKHEGKGHPQHKWAGPKGWGGFDQLETPITDQWTYHAVAAIVKGHSLLRSMPGVDPDRIGITGISWGGILTCITTAIDDRFKFSIPVYGCGFLGEDSAWKSTQFVKSGMEKRDLWLSLWDPSNYLPHTTTPMLWVNGSNDHFFPMNSWQKSYRATKGAFSLSLPIRMPHGHAGPGENPAVIKAFADHITLNSPPLPTLKQPTHNNNIATLQYSPGPHTIEKAELAYTCDTGKWEKRHWQSLPLTPDTTANKVTANLPPNTTVYYFNLYLPGDILISSEHEVIAEP